MPTAGREVRLVPLCVEDQGPEGSGLCLQGTHMHTRQAEPGWWQFLALAVLMEPDMEEEVASVEEEEGPKAG